MPDPFPAPDPALAPERIRAFLARIWSPRRSRPLFSGETPAGRELEGRWRASIEYGLAELGFALRPEVRLRGLRSQEAEPPGWAACRQGVLFITSGAVRERALTPDFLLLDLPYLLIDRPACGKGETPEERIAAGLAAAALTLARAHGRTRQVAGDPVARERVLTRLAASAGRLAAEPVRRLLASDGPRIIQRAGERLEAALPARARGVIEDRPLPAFPITPASLSRCGLPARAIEWVCDYYGWTHTGFEWDGGLLPLQVLGIHRGLCDPDACLYHSGVIAAPTSAGKTLLAEVRLLVRWFRPDARPKRTLILVPTREIGTERAAALRAAYGTRGTERRLRICYSDGEHHGEDGAIRAGHFDVAVLVNEKAKAFQQSPAFWSGIGEVVLDELGTMAEPGRGAYLELALTAVLGAHKGMTALGLARPSRGLEQVLSVMERQGHQPFYLETLRRPVGMDLGLWEPEGKVSCFRDCNTGARRTEPLALEYPRNPRTTCRQLLLTFLKQTEDERARGLRNNLIVAVPTKTDTQHLARVFACLHQDDPECQAVLDANRRGARLPARFQGLEPTYRRQLLLDFLPRGVGFHDADLAREERQLVSDLFRDGDLPVLITTQTLAEGVNLPAQSLVFIGWARRPGYGADETGLPFYRGLATEFIAWVGRVGRFGKRLHRRPVALYLAEGGPGSEEYEYLRALIEDARAPFSTCLAASPAWTEPVLTAVASLTQAGGRPPTLEETLDLLLRTPSAAEEGIGAWIAERARAQVEEIAAEPEGGMRLLQPVEREGLRAWELTPFGRIAHGAGVELETCRRFYNWLLQMREVGGTWDLLDLLALARATPDGRRLELLRASRALKSDIHGEWTYVVDRLWRSRTAAWKDHSPLLWAGLRDLPEQATLLALRAWRQGYPLYPDEAAIEAAGGTYPFAIETAYGLYGAGCNLREKARDFARLVRVLAAIARELPEGTFSPARPERLPPLSDEGIAVPWDLEAVADELVHGLPYAAVPVARLRAEGLTRTWALRLYQKVEALQLAPDLPVLERVKALTEDPEAYRTTLPTHGLRERVREALAAHGRLPLAESLRENPELVRRYYAHPFILAAQLAQGRDRYTALRVVHRRLYSVMRRNASPSLPLVLRSESDVAAWRDRGAVEFLAEIGRPFEDGYRVDQFLVDLDARHGYPLERLRGLAREIAGRLAAHEWTEAAGVQVNWTGGRGFHILGPFRAGLFRPVETVKRALELLLARLTDDVETFVSEQPNLAEPYVVLDISPVMRRGVYRNAFSLHAGAGGVCVPVELARLDAFDPEQEATPAAVLALLERLGEPAALAGLPYHELLPRFWAAVREQFPSAQPLPPLPALPPPPPAPPRAAVPLVAVEETYRPATWPPVLVLTAAQVEELKPALGTAPRVALDLETTGFNPRRDAVRLLSLATEAGCWVVDCAAVDPRPLLEVLSRKPLLGHHLLFDLVSLQHQYGFRAGRVEDSLLLSQLLHAGEGGKQRGFHGLASVARRTLGIHLPKELQGSDWTGELTREQIEYAALDAAVLLPLLPRLQEQITAAGLDQVATIERRCLPGLVWLAASGVPVDHEVWERRAGEAATAAEGLRRELDAVAPPAPGWELGLTWSWDRPASVRDALAAAGCPLPRTDAASLADTDHPLALLIRQYRQAAWLARTYGSDWLRHVEGGRVYPEWRQLGAPTGRLACRAPNITTLPRGRYRQAIAAPPGRVLVRGDYAQIELRVAARLAGEGRLIAALEAGEDLHRLTAAQVLGRAPASGEERQLGKALNYLLLFGGGPEALRRAARSEYEIRLTPDQAEGYRERFFQLYPRLRAWHARQTGEPEDLRTLTGRRRSRVSRLTEKLNTPVQGLAADGLKRALALLWERREQGGGAVPVLVSHDEILVECEEAQAEAAAAWLRRAMVDGMAPLLRPVPVAVEVSIGPTWAGESEAG